MGYTPQDLLEFKKESNSPLLGRIPTDGGGVSKTYEESIIRRFDYDNAHIIREALRNDNLREKLYLDKETGNVVLESNRDEESNVPVRYKELELLNVLPIGGLTSHDNFCYEFIVEVIEKSILLDHLREERELLESSSLRR